jgi:cytochrome b
MPCDQPHADPSSLEPLLKDRDVKVWDLPVRLFHWLIVLTVGFSWYSAEIGNMVWHYWSGVAALVLVLFRLIWGVIGSSTARFSSFVRAPAAVLTYLRRPRGKPLAGGHNPIGGYSVIAMLIILAAQVATGLFAVDVDGMESGPLSYLVAFDQGRIAANVHHLTFTLLQAMVFLHVLAIAFYAACGRRLVKPMITGRDGQLGKNAPELTGGGTLRALLAVAAAALAGWWVSLGAPI